MLPVFSISDPGGGNENSEEIMSLPEQPRVSIVVPTYRDWEGLECCLKALVLQHYLGDRCDVLVVNNAPHEAAPAGIPSPDKARMLAEAKPGSYAARNRGIAEA